MWGEPARSQQAARAFLPGVIGKTAGGIARIDGKKTKGGKAKAGLLKAAKSEAGHAGRRLSHGGGKS